MISIRLLCGARFAIQLDSTGLDRSWPHTAVRHISDEMWSTTFHHEHPRLEGHAVNRQNRAGAEINLRGIGYIEVENRCRAYAALGGQAAQHALHGVVAAGVAVIALKGGMDRGALNSSRCPVADLFTKRFNRRHARVWQMRRASEDARDRGVVWERHRWVQPAAHPGFAAHGRQLLASH